MTSRIKLTGIDSEEFASRDLIETSEKAVSSVADAYAPPPRNAVRFILFGAGAMTFVWAIVGLYRAAFTIGERLSAGGALVIASDVTATALFLLGIALIWLAALIGAKVLEISSTAVDLANAADRMMQPETTAAFEIATIGRAVQTKVDKLNEGLEHALTRLAAAEDLIRHHASLIEDAAEDVERRAAAAADRILSERARLEELSQSLAQQTENVSQAVAKQSSAITEASQQARSAFKDADEALAGRITSMQETANVARTEIDRLSDAVSQQTSRLEKITADTIDNTDRALAEFQDRFDRLDDTSHAFESQNKRLQVLVDAQEDLARRVGERLDRFASGLKDILETGLADLERAAATSTDTTRAAADELQARARETRDAGEDAAASVRAAAEAAQGAARIAREETDALIASLSERETIALDAIDRAAARTEDVSALSKKAINDVIEAAEAAQRKAAFGLKDFENRLSELPAKLASHGEKIRETLKSHIRELDSAIKDASEQARELEIALTPVVKQPERDEFAVTGRGGSVTSIVERLPANGRADADAQMRLAAGDAGESPFSRPEFAKLEALAREIVAQRSQEAISTGEESDDGQKRKSADWRWRDVLAAADGDDAEAEAFRETTERVIRTLQEKSFRLVKDLNGEPEKALINRFLSGERNVFTDYLARENLDMLKSRVRDRMQGDHQFSQLVNSYLLEFDDLLSRAAQRADGDAVMESYLASSPGLAYLALGSAAGYFA
ncbi:MAG: hypothetical protein Tsb0010_07230 [Parvularculaceae bacterium]